MHIETLDVKPGLEISVWDSAAVLDAKPDKVGIEIIDGGKSLLAYLTGLQVDELVRALGLARVALGAGK